jgi:signal transduction histidine kinase
MAMSSQPKLAKDFWGHFSRGVALIIVIAQLLILILVAILLHYVGFFNDNPIAYIATLAAQTALGVIASALLYKFIARPLKDLLAAVIHVSGEPTATTPPNPNDDRYAKNGFKDVLQTIYQLASNEQPKQTSGEVLKASENKDTLVTALNQTTCGFVVMNKDRVITFSNQMAPINIDAGGKQELALIFNGNDSLDHWLEECEQTAVHAEHTWTRVPNKLPEEENRRLFDVYASYSKGTENEVILTIVDRTSTYSTSEQDLDFIAFAAHELRGPITVIRGYLDVLQDELDGQLADDQVELFHRLTVSANRLSGYINNILNTSRYDRRHLKMHLVESSVASIYDTIRDDMMMRATAQGRLLSVNLPTDLPAIAADPNSLSEVFGNLVDNAIKYSNEGSAIDVTAAVKGDFVEVSVEDHGIGMPGNVVSNLFQKFYRSHRSRESVAGTGIGLYISKAIVESHGGSIGVRSEEGKGSTFTVSIPTYASVADKLKASDNSNEGFIGNIANGIQNHSMFRG